jgi:hypothetical protein
VTSEGSEIKANLKNSMWGLGAENARERVDKGTRGRGHNTRKGGTGGEIKSISLGYKQEPKSLVLLQVNCRRIYNKALEFWNIVDTYDPDIVIGTESWLREEMGNSEIFRADLTIFRRDRKARGGRVFIGVRKNITCSELWVDDQFEMISVEVRGTNPKHTWEIVGIYRAPNEDIGVIEKLAARTGYLGNSMKLSIIGGDLTLPHANWKGVDENMSGTQAFINRLVWDNGYKQEGNHCWTFILFDPKVHLYLRYGTRDQRPFRGVIRNGMGK